MYVCVCMYVCIYMYVCMYVCTYELIIQLKSKLQPTGTRSPTASVIAQEYFSPAFFPTKEKNSCMFENIFLY